MTLLTGQVMANHAYGNIPLPGAAVTVVDSAGHTHSATSDANGVYTFASSTAQPLAPGPATVQASAVGFGVTVQQTILQKNQIATQDLILQPTVLSGTVMAALSNSPIAGAKVTVTDSAGHSYSTISDANGAYIFTSLITQPLAPGSSTVTATAAGFGSARQTPTLVAGSPNPQDMRLPPTVVGGIVMEARSQLSLGGVIVTVMDSAGHVYSAVSDASGRYSFATAPGQPLASGLATINADVVGYGAASSTLTLNAGASHTCDLKLSSTMLVGIVQDALSRSPIQGVTVELTDRLGHVYLATTDARGWFLFASSRLQPLAAGLVTLTASASGYGPVTQPFNVVAGRSNSMSLTLPPTVLRGQVIDTQSHAPLVGTAVTITDSMGHIYAETTGGGGEYIFTLSRGHLLAAGAATVKALADGFGSDTQQVTLEEGTTSIQDLSLPPTILTGQATDAYSGQPLERAQVTVKDGAGADHASYTDTAGVYTIASSPHRPLAAGLALVTAKAIGFGVVHCRKTLQAGTTHTQDLSLPPTILTGQVTDDLDHSAIGQATVEVTDSKGKTHTVRTDDSGRYTLTSSPAQPLAAGDAAVEASVPGYGPATETLRLTAGETDSQDLALSPTRLTGQVRDARRNLPIPGAQVQVTDSADHYYTAITNDQGEYSFTSSRRRPLAGGTATLEASAAGYGTATQDVTLTVGVDHSQDLFLLPTTLVGIVTDARSRASLAGARVEVTDHAGLVHTTTTNAWGDYILASSPDRPLASGLAIVEATATDHQTVSQETVLTIGVRNSLDLHLPRVILTGRVVDRPGNSPIRGAMVRLTDPAGHLHATTTDANGEYAFAYSPARPFAKGRATVQVSAAGYRATRQTLELSPATTTRQDLSLSPGQMIACVSCKLQLAPGTSFCPRCGADNREWLELHQANVLQKVWTYVRHSLWAVLPWLVVWLTVYAFAVAVLSRGADWTAWLMAFILSGLISLAGYAARWWVREYEWSRQARKRWRPSIALIIALCFLTSMAIFLLAVILPTLRVRARQTEPFVAPLASPIPTATPTPLPTCTPVPTHTPVPTIIPPPDGRGAAPAPLWEVASLASPWEGPAQEPPPLAQDQILRPELDPLDPIQMISGALFGIALCFSLLGFVLAANLTFAQWLNRRLTPPIFTDRARMARILRREVEVLFESGRRDQEWHTRVVGNEHPSPNPDGPQEILKWEEQHFRRTMPREHIGQGIWDVADGLEEIRTTSRTQRRFRVNDTEESWEILEDRPSIEVRVQQMWRTDDGGLRVRLAVLSGESEKQMKEGNKLVHLRIQEARHYELRADLWGWPLELRDTDDYRLVQLLRKDVQIIGPPTPLALPKTGA